MSKSRRKKTPGPWKRKEYEATPPGDLEIGLASAGKILDDAGDCLRKNLSHQALAKDYLVR